MSENPKIWKNIPICVSATIQNMLSEICNSGEQLFEYQMKSNDRLWRLQKQITDLKTKQNNFEKEIQAQLEMRFRVIAQDERLPNISKQISGTLNQMDDVLQQQQNLEQTTSLKIEENNNRLEQFGRIVKTSLLKLENSLVDLEQKSQENIQKKLLVTDLIKFQNKELHLDKTHFSDNSDIIKQGKSKQSYDNLELKEFSLLIFDKIFDIMQNNNDQLAYKFYNIKKEFVKEKKETQENYEKYIDDKMQQVNNKLKEIDYQLRKQERASQNNFVELMSVKTQLENELKIKIEEMDKKMHLKLNQRQVEAYKQQAAMNKNMQNHVMDNMIIEQIQQQIEDLKNNLIPWEVKRLEEKLVDQSVILKNTINSKISKSAQIYNKQYCQKNELGIFRLEIVQLKNQMIFLRQELEQYNGEQPIQNLQEVSQQNDEKLLIVDYSKQKTKNQDFRKDQSPELSEGYNSNRSIQLSQLQANDSLQNQNQSQTENNEEFIKCLIRIEMDDKLKPQFDSIKKEIDSKIKSVQQNIQQVQNQMIDIQNQNQNKNVQIDMTQIDKMIESLRSSFDDKIDKFNLKIKSVYSQIKVLSCMYNSRKISPNRKKEVDPHYRPYINFYKTLDTEKVALFRNQVLQFIKNQDGIEENIELKELKNELEQFINQIQQQFEAGSPKDSCNKYISDKTSIIQSQNHSALQNSNIRIQQKSALEKPLNMKSKNQTQQSVSDLGIFKQIKVKLKNQTKMENYKKLESQEMVNNTNEQKVYEYTQSPKILSTGFQGKQRVQDVYMASSTLSNQNNIYEYFDQSLSKDLLQIDNSNELVTLERSKYDFVSQQKQPFNHFVFDQQPKSYNKSNDKNMKKSQKLVIQVNNYDRNNDYHKKKLNQSQQNLNRLNRQHINRLSQLGVFSPANDNTQNQNKLDFKTPPGINCIKQNRRLKTVLFNSIQALNQNNDESYQIKESFVERSQIQKSKAAISTDFQFLNI